jgi:hypothetical protein
MLRLFPRQPSHGSQKNRSSLVAKTFALALLRHDSRIGWEIAVLVDRDAEDVLALVKTPLRAVAVMHVKVDNSNLLLAQLLCMQRSNGGVFADQLVRHFNSRCDALLKMQWPRPLSGVA